MLLYVARHGEAGVAASDDLRELTENGISRTRFVYSQCAEKIQQAIATVVCSPLVRARQTAEIALELLPVTPTKLVISEQLLPESTPGDIGKFLDSQPLWPVMLVGHQPVLGELLSWLTDQGHFRYSVSTSSLFALELISPDKGCGSVIWQS